MLFVYDVVVDGEVRETITPCCTSIVDSYYGMREELAVLKKKYKGKKVIARRRCIIPAPERKDL